MKFKYTLAYSAIKYIGYKISGRMQSNDANIGKEVDVNGNTYKIFREIHVLSKTKKLQSGGAIFQVVSSRN